MPLDYHNSVKFLFNSLGRDVSLLLNSKSLESPNLKAKARASV